MVANVSSEVEAQPVVACERCGVTFTCGVTAGEDECWCMEAVDLPPLPVPAPGSANCLCPACLRSARARRAGTFSPM